MFGAIVKATIISFQKGVLFCLRIYMKKVMKLLAFIFEQPKYDPVAFTSCYLWSYKVLSCYV